MKTLFFLEGIGRGSDGLFVKKFIDGYFNLPAKRQPHRLNGAIK